MIMRTLRPWFVALLVLIMPSAVVAQAQTSPAPSSGDQLLKPEQLDALVSPIALYPDTLLSLVLMASTYPLEVVQAARWVDQNKNLKGDALKAGVDKQGWDDSVKSLAATPDQSRRLTRDQPISCPATAASTTTSHGGTCHMASSRNAVTPSAKSAGRSMALVHTDL